MRRLREFITTHITGGKPSEDFRQKVCEECSAEPVQGEVLIPPTTVEDGVIDFGTGIVSGVLKHILEKSLAEKATKSPQTPPHETR